MRIIEAHAPGSVAVIHELFREYADSLEIDLCFQSFDEELAELPGRYAPPEGRLFLAREDQHPAGCVAVRKIEEQICEMKRLYVRPAFRGRGLGRQLAMQTLAAAREIGYAGMRLDTLNSMTPAIALYESLGFQRIPAYYDNPSGGAVFMQLRLKNA